MCCGVLGGCPFSPFFCEANRIRTAACVGIVTVSVRSGSDTNRSNQVAEQTKALDFCGSLSKKIIVRKMSSDLTHRNARELSR